jgi:hypothetical protein
MSRCEFCADQRSVQALDEGLDEHQAEACAPAFGEEQVGGHEAPETRIRARAGVRRLR